MALRSVGRIARGALVVVGGFTVGAGVLSYAAFKVNSPPFRVRALTQLPSFATI